MTISNHLFGLIQCYLEQGVCYYKDFGFNPGFLLVLQVGIAVFIVGFLTGLLLGILQLIKKYAPDKI
jgi:hypothetical protein